jgi:predicted peroxiredoxin
MKMLKLATGTIVLFGTVLCSPSWLSTSAYAQQTPTPETSLAASPATEQRIIVHLNHGTDDLHAAFMALKVAHGLQKKGAQVMLVLTMEGVRIADGRQPQNLRWGDSPMTLAEIYDEFVKAGGKVMVCPLCAQAIGLDEKSLRPGAQFASDPNDIPSLILMADKILDF